MNKKLIIIIVASLIILVSSTYAQDEVDLDNKIEGGQDLTSDEYNKLSAHQKEIYLNIKVSQNRDLQGIEVEDFVRLYDPWKLGHKEALRKIATKADFKISNENREAIKKHLTSISDFKDKDDQDIFTKTAVQDIDIINRNREIFKKYIASFEPPVNSFVFNEKSKGFESFDPKTGFFIPHGDQNKRTPISLDILQKYVATDASGFELGQDGELIIKHSSGIGKEFVLSNVVFDTDETGKVKITESKLLELQYPIIKSGKITSTDFSRDIEIPSNCKSCSATINILGIVEVFTKDLPILLPYDDESTLLSGSAILLPSSISYTKDSEFKNKYNVKFKVSEWTRYSSRPASFSSFIGGGSYVSEGNSIISDIQNGILVISAERGIISAELGVDKDNNPNHPYRLVSTVTVDGVIDVEEGKSKVKIKGGIPTFQGDLPKTPIFTFEGYYISKKWAGRCDIQCYEILKSLNLPPEKAQIDIKIEQIKNYLTSNDPDIRKYGIKILKSGGQTVIPKLKEVILSSNNEKLISDGIEIITEISKDKYSEVGVETLEDLTLTQNKLMRYEAAYALGKLASVGIKSKSKYYNILEEMLFDSEYKSRYNRESIVSFIGKSDISSADALTIIENGFESNDLFLKKSLLSLYDAIEDKLIDTPQMEAFVSRNLNTKDFYLNEIIVSYVAKNKNYPNRFNILRKKFYERTSYDVRLNAFRNSISSENPYMGEIILAGLDDTDNIIKFEALFHAQALGEEGKIKLRERLSDSDEGIRVAAASILVGSYGEMDVLPTFERMVTESKDLNIITSRSAIKSINKIPDKRIANVLLNLYRTSDQFSVIRSSFEAIKDAESEVYNDALLQIAKEKEPLGPNDGLLALERLVEKKDPRYVEVVDNLFREIGNMNLKFAIIKKVTGLGDEGSTKILDRVMKSEQHNLKPLAAEGLARSEEGIDILAQSGFIGDINPEVLKSKIAKVEDKRGIKHTDLYFISQASDQELAKPRQEIVSEINALVSGLSHTKRIDTNGWYKEDFENNKDTLPLVTMIKIKRVLEILQDSQIREQIGSLMEKDINDKNTEYGGHVKLSSQGKIYFDFYSPTTANSDVSYSRSVVYARDSGKSIAGFHFHAVNEDSSQMSGPSGLSDTGGGDLGTAHTTSSDNVVITPIGKGKFNVDYYTPNLQVIDLGNYEYRKE